jgi:hypothetical protein
MRDAFVSGISPEDLAAVAQALIGRAKQGDVQAARLVLDRFVGTQTLAEWPNSIEIERGDILDSLLR